jgi:hypothetical protein
MADEPVVIVDAQGHEHEFPAGFDPQKAIQIVREQTDTRSTARKALDFAFEPTAPGIAARQGATSLAEKIDTANRGHVGGSLADAYHAIPDVASGLLHHPIETLRGGAAGVTQGLGDVVEANSSPLALAALASGGAGKVSAAGFTRAAQALRALGAGANTAFAAQGAHEAATAPDLESRLIGGAQALGGAAGLAHDPGMMPAVRTSARGLGQGMIEASKRPGYVRGAALGVMGGGAAAGHLGAVPAGLTMMALPPVLDKTGHALVRFGTGGSTLVPNLAGSIGEAAPRSAPEPTRVPYDPIIEQNTTPPARTPQFSPAELRQLAKQGIAKPEQIQALWDQLHPPMSAPNLGQGKINLTGPTVVPDAEVAAARAKAASGGPSREPDAVAPTSPLENGLEPGRGPNGIPRALQELNMPGAQKAMATQLRQSQLDPLTYGMTPAELTKYTVRRGIRAGAPFDKQLTDLESGQPSFTHEGEATYDPSNPPPGPSAGGDLGSFEDQLGKAQTPSNIQTPVTRIVEKGRSFTSDKPDTWMVKGHLSDLKAAQLNDMYTRGTGDILRGHVEGPVDFSGSDEFGNEIGSLPTSATKFTPLNVPAPVETAGPGGKLGSARLRKNFTTNDLSALKAFLKDNPDATPEEAMAHLTSEAAARQQMYRTNAGLDRGFTNTTEGEP